MTTGTQAPRTVRVAAAQCEIGTDVSTNIDTLVRMVAQAAAGGAQLVVLPEFGNHLSVYDSAEHAWEVAVDLHDPADAFVSAMVSTVAEQHLWAVANATVRRTPAHGRPARITITQMLFSPTEGLVGQADKQVLMGAERTYLVGGGLPAPVFDTPFGRIGLYCCTDGMVSEPARGLAVRGAEILCNSLNSFSRDQASLHVPARAVESGVWVVASCKVGPLLPEHRRRELAELVDLPESTFIGAGESQVVAPDGTVVARASRSGEEVVVADIDLGPLPPSRPDGTSLLGLRRPEVYGPVAQEVPGLPPTGSVVVEVAAVQAHCGDVDALAHEVRRLAVGGAELIVLPELAASSDGLVADPRGEVLAGRALVDEVAASVRGTRSLVVISVVESDHADGPAGPGTGAVAYSHAGLVVGAEGVRLHQPGVHAPQRHVGWQTVLGDRVKVLATPFGRLSVLVGDDALVPEAARLAVLGGAELVAAPMSIAAVTDLSLVLPERSAENRMCVLVASRPGRAGGSAAFDPPADPVWSRPHRNEPFDGAINDPDRHVARVEDAVLRAALHPARAAEKLISADTDLVHGRRPELRQDLVQAVASAN